ncbi:MAG TPA: ATP-binding cassette domain-containing protein, partial [Acidimicrobiales bacterium]
MTDPTDAPGTDDDDATPADDATDASSLAPAADELAGAVVGGEAAAPEPGGPVADEPPAADTPAGGGRALDEDGDDDTTGADDEGGGEGDPSLTAMATEALGTGEEIIRCEQVEKWFGRFQALKGIDLTVGRQEVVVVIGPSGSGKSTLIRCINRLEEHDRGRIVVDGIELGNDLRRIADVRREVGMVFQSFNLFPHLTVLD